VTQKHGSIYQPLSAIKSAQLPKLPIKVATPPAKQDTVKSSELVGDRKEQIPTEEVQKTETILI